MNAKVFLDTNILVYQFDRSAPVKQRRAIELVSELLRSGQPVISSQAVQEFLNVALRKFATPLSEAELRLVIDDLLEPLCAHTPNPDFYRQALALCSGEGLSFYDALIVQAAIDLDCRILYSEDLQAGRKYGSLQVVNPFAEIAK